MDTIFLISRIDKDDFLANGFAVNELNGAIEYDGHAVQAAWQRDSQGEYLYAIGMDTEVLKAVYEKFDPIMLDDIGYKKWCCAVTDDDSEAISINENLRVKDSVYGNVEIVMEEEDCIETEHSTKY